jgi:hypothetical protein
MKQRARIGRTLYLSQWHNIYLGRCSFKEIQNDCHCPPRIHSVINHYLSKGVNKLRAAPRIVSKWHHRIRCCCLCALPEDNQHWDWCSEVIWIEPFFSFFNRNRRSATLRTQSYLSRKDIRLQHNIMSCDGWTKIIGLSESVFDGRMFFSYQSYRLLILSTFCWLFLQSGVS